MTIRPDPQPGAPRRLTRRRFIQTLGAGALASLGLGGYAMGLEPQRLRVTRYRLTPPGWPPGFKLAIAALADLHAGEPDMPGARIRAIAARANGLNADIIVLLGDYAASHRFITRRMPADEWAEALSGLEAPLGVHAIMGNHDWWDDAGAQKLGRGPISGAAALQRLGIACYENESVRLERHGRAFWLAGLGDQLALRPSGKWGRAGFKGVDDLPATLAQVTDDAPVILLAHEPDIFPSVSSRVSLTLSGHTHGGQVRLFGYSPVVPSAYGNRYAYGHIVEKGRHLIVSGGLGCSILPVRLGMPPEILHVTLGDA